jgi:hypothetical protein
MLFRVGHEQSSPVILYFRRAEPVSDVPDGTTVLPLESDDLVKSRLVIFIQEIAIMKDQETRAILVHGVPRFAGQ